MRETERHELFVHWLTMVLQDNHGRAVVRAMVEEHEMPVIDEATGRRRPATTPRHRPVNFPQHDQPRS
ncbi:MAG: hypothetical protein EBS84_21660 [Proteobacteria bacterium]|nr:hypothetical protein [Pseudomonadota bacterium]